MAQKRSQKQGDGQEIMVFVKGFTSMFRHPIRLALMLIACFICYWLCGNKEAIADKIGIPFEGMVYVIWAVPILLMAVFGAMGGANTLNEKFEQIRFMNPNGEVPKLIRKRKDKKYKNKLIMEFKSPGIEIAKWRKAKDQLESALDVSILKIRQAKDSKQKIILETVAGNEAIPDLIKWDDKYMRDGDFVLTMGRSLLEDVTVNLNNEPHALIAGVTGSGKSVVLRLLFWEAIRKGAKCYAIDFKGGVEFSGPFEEMTELVHETDEAVQLFAQLVREMKMRLELFKRNGVKKLSEYNEKFPDEQLCRIVLVCDEVAELLDKDGLTKEEKEPLLEIEKYMSSLARLSRATGINMLLATQRPDANVIKGQIKNNLPIRISGRMVDEGVSKMVLGTDRATLLDNTRGRFIYTVGSDFTEFQAYLFEDNMMTIGNYVKGKMLTENISDNAKKKLDQMDEAKYTEDFGITKEEQEKWMNPDDVII